MPADHLSAPLLIPPHGFVEATSTLDHRQVGALALVAAAWWPDGEMPEGVELARCLGVRRARAEALMPALRPFFEASGFFAIMRAAALAKAGRRARAGRKGAAAVHAKGGAQT